MNCTWRNVTFLWFNPLSTSLVSLKQVKQAKTASHWSMKCELLSRDTYIRYVISGTPELIGKSRREINYLIVSQLEVNKV